MTQPEYHNDPIAFLISENSRLQTELRVAKNEIERLSGTQPATECRAVPYTPPVAESVALAFTHF